MPKKHQYIARTKKTRTGQYRKARRKERQRLTGLTRKNETVKVQKVAKPQVQSIIPQHPLPSNTIETPKEGGLLGVLMSETRRN